MSYEIRPESVKSFIEDRSIELPRFQRKPTWDAAKNFSLVISIFKKFPLGVVVVNKERSGKIYTKWLLDGRQRRNALTFMLHDPEEIYKWAKRFIAFRSSDQPADIEKKYWMKIDEYLGAEIDEENNDSDVENGAEQEPTEPDEQISDNQDTEPANTSQAAVQPARKNIQDLDQLLEIILSIHHQTKKDSGFTRPFDFTAFRDNLNYVDNLDDGTKHLNSRKLRTWMKKYLSDCKEDKVEPFSEENFYKYVIKRENITDSRNRLKTKIQRGWSKIVKSFELIELIESKLQDTYIGIIELDKAVASDAQNTFKIINTAGSKLNAAEILSAKPPWNNKLPNPSQVLVNEVASLYRSINIKNDGVVKWDVAATFMGRLHNLDFVFPNLDYSHKNEYEKKLTLGFKLLAAVYGKAVSKDDVDALSLDTNIDWGSGVDSLLTDFNNMGQLLGDDQFYQYFKSWKKPMIGIMSEAVAINFLIICYLDWQRKGKPLGSNQKAKNFVKNSKILLDRLFFEYIKKQWWGPSDALIAENIHAFSSLPEIYAPIPSDKWKDLIIEVFDSHSIDAKPLNKDKIDGVLKALLHYYYILSSISGPDDADVDIDHIYPQSLLFSSTDDKIRQSAHHLFNLALLPKKNNISKSDKRLNEITNSWLKEQINKYENIPLSEFDKYSDLRNLDKLKQMRQAKFLSVFESTRTKNFE